MSEPQELAEDPIVSLLEMDGDSAKIIKDPVNGYDRVVPIPEILEQMGELYSTQILNEDINWKPIFEEQIRAMNAYEGLPSDAGPQVTWTVPVCKRITNQQSARIANAILTKNPIITIKPIDGGDYEIPSGLAKDEGGQQVPNQPVPGMPGAPPQPIFQTEVVSSEQAAQLFEAFLQYKLTECLNFEQLVEDTVFAVHQGENPTWWRIDYEPRIRYSKMRQFIKGPKGIQIYGVEDTAVVPNDLVTIRHIPGRNVTMPVTSTDEQTCWWIAERLDPTNTDLWEGIKNGRYDFCLPPGKNGKPAAVPDDLVRSIFGLSEDVDSRDIERRIAEMDLHVTSNPINRHDVRMLSFKHPLRVTRKDGSKAIEIRELCGTLHVKARKFLNLYVNWSWTGKRLYVPFFRHRRPHRFSGMSASGDAAPLQNLMSSIYHLQIQNMVQSNVKVFLIRENSATERWFNKHGELRPGARIPFEDPEDIQPVHLGTQISSMAQEITFIDSQAERLMVTSDYTSGLNAPNRTAAATVAQTDAKAAEQPLAVMRPIRRSIAAAVEMYLQTIAQFSAYERIPFLDPDSKRIISKLIGFPREMIADHFSFHVTATGDEDSSQARFEKAGLLVQDMDASNEAALKAMQILMDPQQPMGSKQFVSFLLLRRERALAEKIQSFKLDPQHYVIDQKKLDEWMVMAPPQPPEGGMGEGQVQSPAPGGAVPVPPGQPVGPNGPPAQPGVPGIPQPPPPPNLGGGAPAGPAQR